MAVFWCEKDCNQKLDISIKRCTLVVKSGYESFRLKQFFQIQKPTDHWRITDGEKFRRIKKMDFLTMVNQDVADMVKGKDEAERVARATALRMNSLNQVVIWLMSYLSGKFQDVNVRVQESTDQMMKFLRLGGIEMHLELFREFFEKRPDAFFIYSLPELWKALEAYPAEQDCIGKVYYNRSLNYVPAEGDSVLDFPWVIKAAFVVLKTAGAPPSTIKGLAGTYIVKYADILSRDEMSSVQFMLGKVAVDGNYILPNHNESHIPNAANGAKDKDAHDGNSRRAFSKPHVRSNRETDPRAATPEEIAAHVASVPSAKSSIQEILSAGLQGKGRRKQKSRVNGHPPVPTTPVEMQANA
jgi:hypothetical protein